ncbi:hypothetical protein [Rhizobium rhizoryzae]|uniref:hypothetical protein n=1 Tax=Rhizobium rhizoryzae TaxID=451876 RepID=UPI0028AA7A2C|nr:hypothetical protein [Rhizobium rhizoryzae]
MRIGIVCEGPTDFLAIRYFIGQALNSRGFTGVEFVDLQPQLDATQSSAGWGNIERWLAQTTATLRVRRYFSGGLFDDDLDTKSCDLIVVQMDCDHLNDTSFVSFNAEKYGLANSIGQSAQGLYSFAVQVLERWCDLASLTQADVKRHIMIPAHLSTESWCIAAFKRNSDDPDLLTSSELVSEFMNMLHLSEGRAKPNVPINSRDKNVKRRESFCKRHASTCHPWVEHSTSFRKAVDKISSVIGQ